VLDGKSPDLKTAAVVGGVLAGGALVGGALLRRSGRGLG
jgi:hypothetical protein